jgi:hypothetical protein
LLPPTPYMKHDALAVGDLAEPPKWCEGKRTAVELPAR